jgi:hypothetical protein
LAAIQKECTAIIKSGLRKLFGVYGLICFTDYDLQRLSWVIRRSR